jgi:hypothetical protein
MTATGRKGNELGHQVGKDSVNFAPLYVSGKPCMQWPLRDLLKPTYRTNVVVLQVK